MKIAIILSLFCALATGQRITTIQLDGVQYFVSRMNPYSPELNYFLAYQYCRSLGLQLASFETKEKVESMSQYLQNAGYSKYDFWTSGNRLGTGMFLWMSTGLPFNATFDYFDNANDAVKAGLLDPVDHNSNTAPQRTARDSNSGLEKGCVILQAPSLRWAPEDCSAVKDFICEQTRCYYYNYGSIPVSSAQGRPLTSTTPASVYSSHPSDSYAYSSTPTVRVPPQPAAAAAATATTVSHVTTPVPSLHAAKSISLPLATLRVTMETSSIASNRDNKQQQQFNHQPLQQQHPQHPQQHQFNQLDDDEPKNSDEIISITEDSTSKISDDDSTHIESNTPNDSDNSDDDNSGAETENISEKIEVTTSVEQRLRKISEEIEKFSGNHNDKSDVSQSFLTLTDFIQTLNPTDRKLNQLDRKVIPIDRKITPQIDSAYSKSMHVQGAGDDLRKIKTMDLRHTNRALY